MFYAHFVLSKKGPLAKVWLAAHWDKKLTKAHVFETDVQKTVDDIISPKVKMALRTTGHLLLGVVRIYSRKQKYLIQDLGEACAKIKMAFRPGAVDLPLEGAVATGDTITLPEIFQNFESAVADLSSIDFQEDRYQSRAEDITLKDDISNVNNILSLNDFGAMGGVDNDEFGGMLEDIELPRRGDGQSFQSHLSDSSQLRPPDHTLQENGGGGGGLEMEGFENRGLEPPGFGEGFGDFGPGGLQDLNLPSPPPQDQPPETTGTGGAVQEEEQPMEVDQPVLPPQEETVREDEGFVLEPLDVTGIRQRQRKKRKLVVDKDKELHGDVIRNQLMNTSDTLRDISFPPPTKKMMLSLVTQGHDYLYSNPTWTDLSSSPLGHLVSRNAHVLPSDVNIDLSALTDIELPREEVPSVVGEEPPLDAGVAPPLGDATLDAREAELELEPVVHGNEPPPLLLPEEGEEEEPVSRIIPDIPDFEAEPDSDAVATTETPGSGEMEGDPVVEERRWNRRTQGVLKVLKKGFQQTEKIHFTDITRKCNKKQAAARFYSCLLLAKEGAIKLEQAKPYSNIIITENVRLIV